MAEAIRLLAAGTSKDIKFSNFSIVAHSEFVAFEAFAKTVGGDDADAVVPPLRQCP
jgi:hypothetical protein